MDQTPPTSPGSTPASPPLNLPLPLLLESIPLPTSKRSVTAAALSRLMKSVGGDFQGEGNISISKSIKEDLLLLTDKWLALITHLCYRNCVVEGRSRLDPDDLAAALSYFVVLNDQAEDEDSSGLNDMPMSPLSPQKFASIISREDLTPFPLHLPSSPSPFSTPTKIQESSPTKRSTRKSAVSGEFAPPTSSPEVPILPSPHSRRGDHTKPPQKSVAPVPPRDLELDPPQSWPPAKRVLLAQKYSEKVDPTGYWMSEKLDGVRAYWNGHHFYSRLGNRFHAPESFRKFMPSGICLDGELWGGRGNFQKTVGIVKSRGNRDDEWGQLSYCVFDVPDQNYCNLPYEDRMAFLNISQKKLWMKTPYLTIVANRMCKGKEDLDKELIQILAISGEGIMLRLAKSVYDFKRSKTLLKVKKFHDEEALIVEVNKSDVGRPSLRCQLPNGNIFSLSSAVPQDAAAAKKLKPNNIITFKYQELTDGGMPRFPVFLRPRDDVTWESTLANWKTKPEHVVPDMVPAEELAALLFSEPTQSPVPSKTSLTSPSLSGGSTPTLSNSPMSSGPPSMLPLSLVSGKTAKASFSFSSSQPTLASPLSLSSAALSGTVPAPKSSTPSKAGAHLDSSISPFPPTSASTSASTSTSTSAARLPVDLNDLSSLSASSSAIPSSPDGLASLRLLYSQSLTLSQIIARSAFSISISNVTLEWPMCPQRVGTLSASSTAFSFVDNEAYAQGSPVQILYKSIQQASFAPGPLASDPSELSMVTPNSGFWLFGKADSFEMTRFISQLQTVVPTEVLCIQSSSPYRVSTVPATPVALSSVTATAQKSKSPVRGSGVVEEHEEEDEEEEEEEDSLSYALSVSEDESLTESDDDLAALQVYQTNDDQESLRLYREKGAAEEEDARRAFLAEFNGSEIRGDKGARTGEDVSDQVIYSDFNSVGVYSESGSESDSESSDEFRASQMSQTDSPAGIIRQTRPVGNTRSKSKQKREMIKQFALGKLDYEGLGKGLTHGPQEKEGLCRACNSSDRLQPSLCGNAAHSLCKECYDNFCRNNDTVMSLARSGDAIPKSDCPWCLEVTI